MKRIGQLLIYFYSLLMACPTINGQPSACPDGSTVQSVTFNLQNRQSNGPIGDSDNDYGIYNFGSQKDIIGIEYERVKFKSFGTSTCDHAWMNVEAESGTYDFAFAPNNSSGNCGKDLTRYIDLEDEGSTLTTNIDGDLQVELFETINDPVNPDTKYNKGLVYFYVCPTPAAPLPVEWLSFSSKIESNNVVLSWQTAVEINNMGFQIERSHDGVHFDSIGFVEGAGTLEVSSEYEHIDHEWSNHLSYYRIMQIDFDGNSSYSRIISVENRAIEQSTLSLELQKNVFTSPQQIEANVTPGLSDLENFNILIVSASGQVYPAESKIISHSADRSGISVGVSRELDAGLYWLKMITGNAAIHKTFLVQ